MTQRPNILLIVTDTQRCDTLKCMGNPHAVSPNIDRLARVLSLSAADKSKRVHNTA